MDIRLRRRSKIEIINYFSEKLTKANEENKALREWIRKSIKQHESDFSLHFKNTDLFNLKESGNDLLNPQHQTEVNKSTSNSVVNHNQGNVSDKPKDSIPFTCNCEHGELVFECDICSGKTTPKED